MSRTPSDQDLAEALEALARLRRVVGALAAEAEDRRRRAIIHAAGCADEPLHPRAQGLRDAAAFHAARLDEGRRRLAAAERQVAAMRGAAGRREAGGHGSGREEVRRCG